ncbi:MAG: DUF4321 domain-containing protein [Gemmatimonadales bacterium]|nr:MAG: DUF4321 domain-containing protein [Gemmatimonadales bacterium]
MNGLLDSHERRSGRRSVWVLVIGLFLGGLLTLLSERFLPDSAARDFLTTSVAASLGPLHVDLVAVALTLGPLSVSLNVLTVVGILITAVVARSLI